MRENNRKSIERCRKKLPQFTTMNVIDGQAGLVIYSSLIFYSLIINNILNIIVLLILASVIIATLSGDNGLLAKAQQVKEETHIAQDKEQIQFTLGEYQIEKLTSQKTLATFLQETLKNSFVIDNGDGTATVTLENCEHSYIVSDNGIVGQLNENIEAIIQNGNFV